MTGIVGRALAGGGGALEVAGLSILRSELDEKRQTRLQELAHAQQSALQERGQTFTAGENQKGREHQTALQGAGFLHTENMAAARRAFDEEQNKLNRNLTREQITSNERQQNANRANALEIAKIGGTVQQDKDGRLLFFTKDGKAQPIMDPATNQPLMGNKDLTPAAKAYADVIGQQLKQLDTLEASPMTDDNTRTQINQRRTQLNTDLLNVLTGGISAAGKGGGGEPTIPQAAIDALKKNPALADDFKAKYKVDPSKYLTGGQTPAPAPRAVQPKADTPAAETAETPEAEGVDAARSRLAEAENTLKSYGLLKRRQDPQGFEEAKRERDEAKRLLEESLSKHQSSLGDEAEPYFGR